MGTQNILGSPIANEHGGANMKSSRHRRHLLAIVAVAAIGGLGAGVVPQFANATRPHPRSLGAPTAATTASLTPPAAADCQGDASCTVALYAKAGTVTAGATVLPIWGFTTDNSAGGHLGGDPANTIVMDEGQSLNLTVHNCLPSGAGDLYVEMPAASGPPPAAGAAVDTSAGCTGAGFAQTFSGLTAGTYVYQAGATVEQERQLAMGLAALVVVRPTGYSSGSPTAYDGGMGAFKDEALVVMNEIDPKFNADPFAGDVEDYNPQYFFINGKAHPNTDDIGANNGDIVLLRAANLGIRDRALGLLNARLNLLAVDSHKVDEEHATVDLESQLLTPGQVADLTTRVDPNAPPTTQLPVLDMDRELTNGSQTGGLGGMLTFIDVLAGPAPATPAVAKVTGLTPADNDGTTNISVAVTFSGGATGASWSVDSGPQHSLGSRSDGAATITVPIAQVLADGASTGDHVIWITPTGGTKSGGTFTLALGGPSVFGLSVDPPFANISANKVDGTNMIVVTGSVQPSLLDYAIDNVELCVDATGCGTSVMADVSVPVGPSHAYGLRTLVDPDAFAAQGDDVIYIRAHEAPVPLASGTARWSDWTPVHVTIDREGPSVTNVTASPSPAGIGNYPGNLNFLESVRIDADLNDTLSPIADAELFLYAQDATGTGAQLRPLSGQWLDDVDTPAGAHTRHGYLEVPISELQSQPQGTIHIYIHAKDAAGNWGEFTTFSLVLDKTNPQILNSGTDVAASHHYQAQDETGAWVLTAGSIAFKAQDPNMGDGVFQLPTTPGGNQVQIRYHVSSIQGTIGQAGAGIFYQTGQEALGAAVANGDGTYNVTFDWHLVYPDPGRNVLPPEAATQVWVWVLDAAGNPSDPIIVDVAPPTSPTGLQIP